MTAPDPSAREIVIRRTIAAPPEVVFAAFTEPQRLGAWFGPAGFTTTTHALSATPGGLWRYVMSGRGMHFYNWARFQVVDSPHRLAYEQGAGDPDSPAHFQVSIGFTPAAGGTEVVLRTLFPTPEARQEAARDHRAADGGEQSLARLASHLADQALAGAPPPARLGKPFVITRTFQAPRALVWKAWTEAYALCRWFGPTGCTIIPGALDLRPGGVFHYGMQTPGGTMWGKWIFREVVAPKRLVLIQHFSDATGGVTRHPMSPSWPLHTLSELDLAESSAGTALTITWRPWDADTLGESTFDKAHPDMQRGWGGTLDALAQFLSSQHQDQTP